MHYRSGTDGLLWRTLFFFLHHV